MTFPADLSEPEEWVRCGQGQGDLSVGPQVSIGGQDPDHLPWGHVRVVAFRDEKSFRETRELWAVVIIVQDSDVELGGGTQAINSLIHCYHLNTKRTVREYTVSLGKTL